MNGLRWIGAAVGLLGFGFAAPASAALMLATFTGVALTGGYDRTGEFGPADIALRVDTPFTATFLYDSQRGAQTGSGPGEDRRYGGGDTGDLAPILKATFSINGVITDLTFPGDALAQSGGAGFHYFNISAFQESASERYLAAFYLSGDGVTVPNLATPFSGPLTGGYGVAYIHRINKLTNGAVEDAEMYLRPTALTVERVAVPEPMTWALMILGFGAVGASARVRAKAGGAVRASAGRETRAAG